MRYLFILIIIFVIACNQASQSSQQVAGVSDKKVVNANGETLFKANCASCHKPNEKYVGPALQGVEQRWENKELLYAFVRNSQDVISRNEYAKQLYKEYNESPMLPYPNLSDKDIDDILDYCKTYVPE